MVFRQKLRVICNLIKSDKNNFTCIQCPGKELFRTLPDDTQCSCYSLLAEHYYVTFGLWHEPSVCRLSVIGP